MPETGDEIMGIDYYKCDKCGECYADCDISVRTCKQGHGLCDDCVGEINLKNIKYFHNSEPAIEDDSENILPEFCPICSKKLGKPEERPKLQINDWRAWDIEKDAFFISKDDETGTIWVKGKQLNDIKELIQRVEKIMEDLKC